MGAAQNGGETEKVNIIEVEKRDPSYWKPLSGLPIGQNGKGECN